MEKIEIVKNLFSAIEQNNFEKAKSYLTSDFKVVGAPPQPIGADEWINFHKIVNKGIPDFKFNFKNGSESGNTVNGVCQVGGTFTNEMPSFSQGKAAIKPTNKTVFNPKENVTVTFKGEKIQTLTVEKVQDGGMNGFLKKIGAELPAKV